jgi:DeoR family transcriptional regulator of aga operon
VALPQSYELVGPLANGVFDQVTLDIAFLGVSGLDIERGATCVNEEEASINRQMALRAERVAVVADGSKLGERAFAKICGIGEIDLLVTDTNANATAFEEAGIKVVRA